MGRIAMLSVHSCPLAALGGKETGGMNVYIRELSRSLAERGCTVDIFTRSQNPRVPVVVPFCEDVRIVHLKAGPESPYEKSRAWSHLPEFLDNLEQFRRGEDISYSLIHSHYWLSGWVGAELGKRWNVPLLHMFHTVGYFKNRATQAVGAQEPEVRLQVEQQLIADADHITVSSQREKVDMIWTYGAPPEKITVVPCGVDTQMFRPLDATASKNHLGLPDKKLILFVGRIDPVKGIDTLLKAMVMVRKKMGGSLNARLLIVGGDKDSTDYSEDSEIARLKRLTAKLNIQDTVTFLGSQRQDLLPYYYSAAEMCILPSRYESFGMVALEAMSCGTPVIASKVGGLTSLIQDERCGFVVPEGNERALTEKICLLLGNPALRETLGWHARERATQYGWHAIADRILALYRTLSEGGIDDAQLLLPFCRKTGTDTAAPVITCCEAC
jgi:D-inositol-3-phosphate glycosyltransferase